MRDLQNVLERATIFARGATIGVADLPELSAAPERSPASAVATDDEAAGLPLKQRVDAYERS